jgi:hypothetical protein
VNHPLNAVAVVVFAEVGEDPLFEVFGFAYINDIARFIHVFVDTR